LERLIFCSEELLQCLEDEDPWIRYYTIKAISKACDPEILLEKISSLLDDPFPPVVIAAIEALEETGNPEKVYDMLVPKQDHPAQEVKTRYRRFYREYDSTGCILFWNNI